jgi:kumamolisin
MAEPPAGYQELEGSARSPMPGATRSEPAGPDERASVSVCLRSRLGAPPLPDLSQPDRRPARLTRADIAAVYGADPGDIAAVEAFAADHGLTVEESSIALRTVVLAGTAAQLSAAFAVDLGRYQAGPVSYRGHEGPVHLPADLIPAVEGVLGLDDRPVGRPFLRFAPAPPAPPAQPGSLSFSPVDVANFYQFPAGADATGQCIALLEFGGGFHRADIRAWFTALGQPEPDVVVISTDGARNSPGDSPSDAEAILDIDVAGAVAPGARIAVYFAVPNERGWLDAVSAVILDAVNAPSVLSISWGGTEEGFSKSAMDQISRLFQVAGLLGITVLAASGDDGSGNGVGDHRAHVNYPACDPFVTACGGTSLLGAGPLFRENLWNDNGTSGGGISVTFPVPAWQSAVAVPVSVNDGRPGRGIPDIAGNADPFSGYPLIQNGQLTTPAGGTSAVPPLYAGLVAVLNARLNKKVGFLNPVLYGLTAPGVLRDVTCCDGNATDSAPGYPVGIGWDATTGFGSINGRRLLAELRRPGAAPIVPVITPLLLTARPIS